jgi:hypothetical protein
MRFPSSSADVDPPRPFGDTPAPRFRAAAPAAWADQVGSPRGTRPTSTIRTLRPWPSAPLPPRDCCRPVRPGPEAEVHVRPVDGRERRPRPVRRADPGADRRPPDLRPRRRRRGVRRQLPRQRPDPDRRHARAGRRDQAGVPQGAEGQRAGRPDGDDEPVHRPGVQGRGVHQQQRPGPRLRDPEDDAGDGPRGRVRGQERTCSGAAGRAPRRTRPRARSTRSSGSGRR